MTFTPLINVETVAEGAVRAQLEVYDSQGNAVSLIALPIGPNQWAVATADIHCRALLEQLLVEIKLLRQELTNAK